MSLSDAPPMLESADDDDYNGGTAQVCLSELDEGICRERREEKFLSHGLRRTPYQIDDGDDDNNNDYDDGRARRPHQCRFSEEPSLPVRTDAFELGPEVTTTCLPLQPRKKLKRLRTFTRLAPPPNTLTLSRVAKRTYIHMRTWTLSLLIRDSSDAVDGDAWNWKSAELVVF